MLPITHRLYDLAQRAPKLTSGFWFALVAPISSLLLIPNAFDITTTMIVIVALMLMTTGLIAGTVIGYRIIPIQMRGPHQSFFRGVVTGAIAHLLAVVVLLAISGMSIYYDLHLSGNEPAPGHIDERFFFLGFGSAIGLALIGWPTCLICGFAGLSLHLLLRDGSRGRMLDK